MMRTRRQSGFTLVELMVSITLGSLVMAVLAVAFASSSQARRDTDQASRQVENGRYAMQLLSDDFALAGYYAEFDPWPMSTPAAKPDPCATSVASLKAAMPLHVQGYDNPTASTAATLTCLSDVRAGTDIVVIRRVSTCVAGSTDCDAFVGGTTQAWFQTSLCASATELDSSILTDHYSLDTVVAGLTRHKRDCATLADFRRFVTRIYFVANNDNPGDGIPTLKRAELGAAGFTIVPLVEGIENLQYEYGLDTSVTPDGAPDVFTADPDSYTGAGSVGATGNWRNVVAVRVNLLARNTASTPGYADSKVYALGRNADGSANNCTPGSSTLCLESSYRRHAFVAEMRLTNPSARGTTP